MHPGKYFCLLRISYLLIFIVHYSISDNFENHLQQSVISENDFYDHDDGDLDDDQQHPDHRSSIINGQTKNSNQFSGSEEARCERITIPLCLDTPYNFTRMPNLFDHHDQQSAAVSIEEYNLLINQECSEHLKFFLCSIYAPMCTEAVDISVTSCRSD
uniref:FZ domain-containing protein n=1 Tax=Romanomermis culicivorax TaxID=13658 RepID=A0A915IKS9_ROMCU